MLRALAIAVVLAGCGGSRGTPVTAPVLGDGWTMHVDASGAYEVAMPPGAALALDETGRYATWSTDGAFFGVLRHEGSADLAALVLEASRRDASVTVEIDETVRWNDVDAHRVRMTIRRHVEREWVEDPSSGERRHVEERDVAERADFVSFRGSTVSIRAGYRVAAGTPSEIVGTLEAMLASVRVRDSDH